jgi:hypothetical protein
MWLMTNCLFKVIEMKCKPASLLFLILLAALAFGYRLAAGKELVDLYCGIHVVDDETGRGVPLVELETVNHLKWVTDSAGWAAVFEPGLMGQEVFFHVRSHGYQYAKDGFGYAGLRLQLEAGSTHTIRIKRVNVAERLYRVTGEGIYRDSVLLDRPTPLQQPLGSGMVAGQDSVSVVQFQERLFWFWGDTSRMSYPLGHFWMACATSGLPDSGALDPADGVQLKYLTDTSGFSRPVARLGVEQGVIWADGFLVLPDSTGTPRLVCHYAHLKSLGEWLDHGLAVFDEQQQEFHQLKRLDSEHRKLFPGQAHPIRHATGSEEYLYFGEVFPNVRVKADWRYYLDPDEYEVFTCVHGDEASDHGKSQQNDGGSVEYRWQRSGQPIDSPMEQRLVRQGRLQLSQAHFLPRDVDTGEAIVMHRGSIRWNAFRQRWIMIAVQSGGTSELGEVWYAEAESITGPWRKAKKIVTHDRYSFYNPVHHAFFDQEGGRRIYFEGTYSHTFSGNDDPTPRYDYNQIMYRLDLGDPRLTSVRSKSEQ